MQRDDVRRCLHKLTLAYASKLTEYSKIHQDSLYSIIEYCTSPTVATVARLEDRIQAAAILQYHTMSQTDTISADMTATTAMVCFDERCYHCHVAHQRNEVLGDHRLI